MSELVLLAKQGDVATITLNRPERHNSLVPPLLEQLLSSLQTLAREAETRAVVLQANGRSFSTGGDMRGFYEHLETIGAYADELVGLLNEVILAMLALPAPIVVAVDGQVTGGSMGLVLAGDIVLVSPNARFTPYYTVVGFSPDGGWTAMLPYLIGRRRAADILYHNHAISAEQAVEWGVANSAVPAGRIRNAAMSAARDIAAKRTGATGHAKQLLCAGYNNVQHRLEQERAHFVAQIQTPEAQQGLREFLEGQRKRREAA